MSNYTNQVATQRQQQILDFMVKHLKETRLPATFRVIMAATGINTPNGVMCHLAALERKGLVVKQETRGGRHTYLPAIVENKCPLCGGDCE